MPHLIHNGNLISAAPGQALSVPVSNRGFLYADGLFETVRVVRGKVMWLEEHFMRIREGLKAHRIHPPLGFTPASLQSDIQRLVDAEGFADAARVRRRSPAVAPGTTHRMTVDWMCSSWPRTRFPALCVERIRTVHGHLPRDEMRRTICPVQESRVQPVR